VLTTFAVNLRAELDRRKIAPAELARRSNLPSPTIHRYLTGQREPTLANAARIAAALKITVDKLVRSGRGI